MRKGLHEDLAAVLIGLAAVLLALAVTWQARPTEQPGSRELHPKGWATPLAETIGKPGTWSDQPLAAFQGTSGGWKVQPILLGMGWVVLVGGLGVTLGGRSLRAYLPGAVLLVALACLAYLLAGQKTVKYYNLSYPLWALMVGLLVSNAAGVPRWLAPAMLGEFFIKTGLVVFGAEVLVGRLLALGLPGLLTSWIVTPIVLVTTYLLGVRLLDPVQVPLHDPRGRHVGLRSLGGDRHGGGLPGEEGGTLAGDRPLAVLHRHHDGRDAAGDLGPRPRSAGGRRLAWGHDRRDRGGGGGR